MSATPLQDELHRLEHEENLASEKRIAQLDAVRQANFKGSADLTAGVRKYAHDVEAKLAPFSEEEARKVTLAFCDKVRDEGLIFGISHGALQVFDPRPSNELERLTQEHRSTKQARLDFEEENADALATEEKEANATLFREAVAAGDVDGARDALGIG